MSLAFILAALASLFIAWAVSNWSHSPARIRRLNARAAIKAHEKAVARARGRRTT